MLTTLRLKTNPSMPVRADRARPNRRAIVVNAPPRPTHVITPKKPKPPKPVLSPAERKERQLVHDGRAFCCKNYRHLFPRQKCDKHAPVPLAIGIHLAILDEWHGLDNGGFIATLNAFLRYWTRRPEYLRTLVEGAVRNGLDGKPAGVVSAAHAKMAAAQLAKLQRRKT